MFRRLLVVSKVVYVKSFDFMRNLLIEEDNLRLDILNTKFEDLHHILMKMRDYNMAVNIIEKGCLASKSNIDLVVAKMGSAHLKGVEAFLTKFSDSLNTSFDIVSVNLED